VQKDKNHVGVWCQKEKEEEEEEEEKMKRKKKKKSPVMRRLKGSSHNNEK
jgi:hypothetical protein